MRYAAETEFDDNLVDARWAAFDAAHTQIDAATGENEDDERLIEEYETNIREVRNGFRITKAKLVSERTNAELMVAIKQDMNMAEDRADIDTRREAITLKLETAASDKADELNAEFERLGLRIGEILESRDTMALEIERLTAKVTETDALALTIEAVIADEEAALALDRAAAAEAALVTQLEELDGEIGNLEFYRDMAFDESERDQYVV